MKTFYIYIVSLVYLSLKLHVYCLNLHKTKKKLVYRGFSKYVANTHGSFGF